MKIAIIGLYFATNLGDAIICDCVAEWIKTGFPDFQIDIIDIEGRKKFPIQTKISKLTRCRRRWNLWRDIWFTKNHISDRIYYWNFVDVNNRLTFYDGIIKHKYDAVIFAGGQLFMDWLCLDLCEFLKRFKIEKTPVFFNACGVGAAYSKTIQTMFSKEMENDNIKLISSRDDVECIEKRYLNKKSNVKRTYDPALWAKETYKLEHRKSDIVGLGIMYLENISQHKAVKFWIEIIRNLDKRKIKWKMFSNGDLEDYEFGCRILKKLNVNPMDHMISRALTPKELVVQISGFKSIISFRLHSHIVATSFGIPGVGIEWDKKIKFFYESIGYPERCKKMKDGGNIIVNMLILASQEGVNMEVVNCEKIFAKKMLLNELGKVIYNE